MSLTFMVHYSKTKQSSNPPLKALFNNIFTLTNLSCMSLHAVSVFDKE